MIRSTASKVMWVGRAAVFLVGLVVILALVFGVATTALAGTGVGAAFNLGKVNTVNKLSTLVGSTASSMLMVDNNGSGTALYLKVGQGTDPATKTVAPMKVDSQQVVTNLNADQLDGRDSNDFDPLLAYIGSTGNQSNSPDVISSQKVKTGTYTVEFGRDVSNCHRVAMLAQGNDFGFLNPANVTGTKGEVSTFRPFAVENNLNKVGVNTFDSAGTAADRSFELAVYC